MHHLMMITRRKKYSKAGSKKEKYTRTDNEVDTKVIVNSKYNIFVVNFGQNDWPQYIDIGWSIKLIDLRSDREKNSDNEMEL